MRVLLVSPAFHGYWLSISRALEHQGHLVTPAIYGHFDTVRAKAKNKLLSELPDRLGTRAGTRYAMRQATELALKQLQAARVDAALVVKGDLLLDAFWDKLERRGVPAVLWLYDELRRTHHRTESLSRPRHVATYARTDAQALADRGLSCSYVPLAFDPNLPTTRRDENAVVFVGARYPERERLLMQLHRSGLPVVAYGREWSPRWRDRVRCWQLRRPDVPGRPDVERSKALGIFEGAAAGINIHGDQDGFNIRTFEVPGSGGLQLIDRRDVGEVYEPGTEVVPFASDEELVDFAERAFHDRAWSRRIREAGQARTLANHTFNHRVRELLSAL